MFSTHVAARRRGSRARGAAVSPSAPRFHSHSGSRHPIGSAATGAISPSEPHSAPPKKYGRDYAHSGAARRQWWTWVDGRVQQALLCNEWEECQPCLSGRHASCRSPGPSLVGLWPLAATARKGTRVSASHRCSKVGRVVQEEQGCSMSATLKEPACCGHHHLPTPAAQQKFESMARVPVLTASSPQLAEGMARSAVAGRPRCAPF